MAQDPKYFDRRSDLFRGYFTAGLPYEAYVASGRDNDRKRWADASEQIRLTTQQAELVRSFRRPMHVLVLSGTWCGDCVRQVPILWRIEAENAAIQMRLLDRDANPELRDELRLCGAAKVPIVVFLSEDFHECGRYGDRTLPTYRAMARTQLGPACPIGPEPLDHDERSRTIAAWVDEVERMQLMLRLSPALRERHAD